MLFLLIALGGALGGVARYLCMVGVTRYAGERFPWGTLCVNCLGTFLLGAFLGAGIVPTDGVVNIERMHAFVAIGFCGGLTTFSTFSLQTFLLVSKGEKLPAVGNVFGGVALCLFCAAGGFAILERLTT